MRSLLHWLPFQQRVIFLIAALVWRCLLGLAPAFLRDLSCPNPGTRSRSSLHFTEPGVLFAPFAPCFHKADPCILGGWPICMEWASMALLLLPRVYSDTFYTYILFQPENCSL